MLHNDRLAELVAGLNAQFSNASSQDIIEAVVNENIVGKIAVVSSFGAESAVLLHMIAQARKDVPVVFIDTEFIFAETLEYLKELAIALKLEDIRRIVPDPVRLALYDSDGNLHRQDQDQCCHLRKTLPLQRALGEFGGWITGRKRFQSQTRNALEIFERDPITNRIKVNPLVHWDSSALSTYLDDHNLPRHPLVARGYPSIGCWPCTSKVAEGEDARAGRWRGQDKEECGIHFVDGKLVRMKVEEQTT